MSDNLMSREEAQKLLDADRQARRLSTVSAPKPQTQLMPNTLHPYWVYFIDETIAERPVIAWHPGGQPMVVDSERGMLVQAMAIGDIADIRLAAS